MRNAHARASIPFSQETLVAALVRHSLRTCRLVPQKLGYRILQRNYTCPLGEIDIIALDGVCVVFVEVRSTENSDAANALASVDSIKQQRLTRLALLYLQKNRLLEQQARFDVLIISWPQGQQTPAITHLPAALEARGGRHQIVLLIPGDRLRLSGRNLRTPSRKRQNHLSSAVARIPGLATIAWLPITIAPPA